MGMFCVLTLNQGRELLPAQLAPVPPGPSGRPLLTAEGQGWPVELCLPARRARRRARCLEVTPQPCRSHQGSRSSWLSLWVSGAPSSWGPRYAFFGGGKGQRCCCDQWEGMRWGWLASLKGLASSPGPGPCPCLQEREAGQWMGPCVGLQHGDNWGSCLGG